jgi:hypothetical protein
LLDASTGVYWASDCFATSVPHALVDVAELPEGEWVEACYAHAQQLSPWLSMVDPAKYHMVVDFVAGAGITTIASCHSPTITGVNVDRAFGMLHEVIDVPPIGAPGQELLDQIIAVSGPERTS